MWFRRHGRRIADLEDEVSKLKATVKELEMDLGVFYDNVKDKLKKRRKAMNEAVSEGIQEDTEVEQPMTMEDLQRRLLTGV